MNKLAIIMAAAWLAGGCVSRDRESSAAKGKPPRAVVDGAGSAQRAEKGNRVFDVETSEDLLRLNSHYMNLCSSGFDGTLEIRVGKGPFVDQGWSLFPERGDAACPIDVVLRGSGVAFPFPGRVRARSLLLEDVLISGLRAGAAEIRVARSFAMRRTVIVDGRLGDDSWTGGYLEVYPDGGRKVPASVEIEDSWFVRNYQAKAPAQLLQLGSTSNARGYFDKVAIRRSAFLGNAFSAGVAIYLAQEARIEDSLFYRTWPEGAELRATSCGAVEVVRSTFVVEKADQVASVEATPAVVVRDSRVLVRDAKPQAKLPAALAITAAQVSDRAAFTPREAKVTEAIQALTTQPPHAPPAELWKTLQAAFGS